MLYGKIIRDRRKHIQFPHIYPLRSILSDRDHSLFDDALIAGIPNTVILYYIIII